MNINLKEGWLILDIIFTHGGERWIFSETKPYADEYWDGKLNEFVSPGKMKRIMYVEVES